MTRGDGRIQRHVRRLDLRPKELQGPAPAGDGRSAAHGRSAADGGDGGTEAEGVLNSHREMTGKHQLVGG